MNFTRPKKIVFCNNKGGVGKTTLLFNIAAQAHKMGLKIMMVDLDPQTNLTMNVFGEGQAENLFNGTVQNIYDVVSPLERGVSDINTDIKPYIINQNFLLVPGSLKLSSFEDKVLNSSFTEAASNSERGFRIVSSINRYINKVAADNKIDLVFIDTSPNLGSLNKAAILASDFFIVPVNPDIFSVQGVENIGTTYTNWEKDWGNGPAVVGGTLPNELMLKNDPVFLGWVVNEYVKYDNQPAMRQQTYIQKLKSVIKEHLSGKHTKNGLFETTQEPLGQIQDFGTLMQRSHEAATPICYIDKSSIDALGSKEVYDNVNTQIQKTTQQIVELAAKYQNA